MFNLAVPFTKEDGALAPIRILSLAHELLHETRGLLVTGSGDSLISVTLAEKIGLRLDIPCFITMNDGATTIEITETFRAVELQWDVILGMSFMCHFRLLFDGPNRQATLTQ